MIYRPIRERPAQEVLDAIDDLVASTGYDEIGLVSLSTSDHSGIAGIIRDAMAHWEEDGLSISLPSLRIDSFSLELAQMIQSTRKSGFTFAPEAGSQRLRNVINKGVTEMDLMRTAEAAFASGWNRIKLYFMIGLPTETDEDVEEIARLVGEILALGRAIRGRRVDVAVSISTFVPKPHTPFQWSSLASKEVIERRQRLLRDHIRGKGVHLSWSDWMTTWLEATLSRGDRRLGAVIHTAWKMGAHFDAWHECFRGSAWMNAFDHEHLDPEPYATRARTLDQHLPWDHIDAGITRGFLWREFLRSQEGQVSPDCRGECHHCGVSTAFAEERDLGASDWRCP